MTVTTTGEVFTRRWVVELMLDMAEYRGDVSRLRVVEPSVGGGAFVGPIVERLAASGAPWHELRDSLRGYDLRAEHVQNCRCAAASRARSQSLPLASSSLSRPPVTISAGAEARLRVGAAQMPRLPEWSIGTLPTRSGRMAAPTTSLGYQHSMTCPRWSGQT